MDRGSSIFNTIQYTYSSNRANAWKTEKKIRIQSKTPPLHSVEKGTNTCSWNKFWLIIIMDIIHSLIYLLTNIESKILLTGCKIVSPGNADRWWIYHLQNRYGCQSWIPRYVLCLEYSPRLNENWKKTMTKLAISDKSFPGRVYTIQIHAFS